MHFHQVEVDDEVYQFVKKHAEPLVDSFNSTLKRLLPLADIQVKKTHADGQETPITKASSTIPPLPKHIPQALRHIIEVVLLVRGGAYSRTLATRYVAKRYNVFPQTVLDKYCRQLNLTTNQFDKLLEESDLRELREILKSKFKNHAQVVDEVLRQ